MSPRPTHIKRLTESDWRGFRDVGDLVILTGGGGYSTIEGWGGDTARWSDTPIPEPDERATFEEREKSCLVFPTPPESGKQGPFSV